jgi:hypothetical protein
MRELTWQEVLFAAVIGLVLAYVGWYLAHRIRPSVVQGDDPARAFVERFYFGPRPVRVIEMTKPSAPSKHEPAKEVVPNDSGTFRNAAPPVTAPLLSRAMPRADINNVRPQTSCDASKTFTSASRRNITCLRLPGHVPDFTGLTSGSDSGTRSHDAAVLADRPRTEIRNQMASSSNDADVYAKVNICSRHHMRRVEHGRGWRCRK